MVAPTKIKQGIRKLFSFKSLTSTNQLAKRKKYVKKKFQDVFTLNLHQSEPIQQIRQQ